MMTWFFLNTQIIAFLIEHFGGAFPIWMAPQQVVILSVSEVFNDYAHELVASLRQHQIRASVDMSEDSFNKKTEKIDQI